jgi:hypothetical protein
MTHVVVQNVTRSLREVTDASGMFQETRRVALLAGRNVTQSPREVIDTTAIVS